jgi:hypothetical protein
MKCHRPNASGFDGTAGAGTITFVLQASTDNSTWVDLASGTKTDFDGAGLDSVTVDYSGGAAYRYHRVKISSSDSGTGQIASAEIELFGY